MTIMEISAVLGNLAEFIGAFGVMASLIYVGLQIKITRNVVMADSHASIAQATREMYRSIVENPHLAELLSRDTDDVDADKLMVQSFWVAVLMRLEDTYTKFEYGLLESKLKPSTPGAPALARHDRYAWTSTSHR